MTHLELKKLLSSPPLAPKPFSSFATLLVCFWPDPKQHRQLLLDILTIVAGCTWCQEYPAKAGQWFCISKLSFGSTRVSTYIHLGLPPPPCGDPNDGRPWTVVFSPSLHALLALPPSPMPLAMVTSKTNEWVLNPKEFFTRAPVKRQEKMSIFMPTPAGEKSGNNRSPVTAMSTISLKKVFPRGLFSSKVRCSGGGIN